MKASSAIWSVSPLPCLMWRPASPLASHSGVDYHRCLAEGSYGARLSVARDGLPATEPGFIDMADDTQALQELSRAPLENFVRERTRLAAQLRTVGKVEAAKELAKRRRPTASAWTVNQLYWHSREAFDALLAAAARLRKGDLTGTQAYREALGELRKRATVVLRDASHAATVATLGRVMGTLAA